MTICREEKQIYHLCVAALWADEINASKVLEETLQLLEASDHLQDDKESVEYEFGQVVRRLTKRVLGDGEQVSTADVDELAAAIQVGSASSFDYCTALWYKKAGNTTKAIQYYDKLIGGPFPHIPQSVLAAFEKNQQGR